MKNQVDKYNYYVEQVKSSGYVDEVMKDKDETIVRLSKRIDELNDENYKTITFWKFVKLKIFK